MTTAFHPATRIASSSVRVRAYSEKRRVCLAGVLVCGPGLLLLDEPSSGLDPRGRRGLAGLLTGLPATQVIATHDLVLVERVCPRAIVVDAGAIVADGPTAVVPCRS